MAINKEKLTASAKKYFQKGQYDKAIVEYKKILSAYPNDIRSLQKIGDLQVRTGKKNDAIETYLKLTEIFINKGFFSKAVAILKQIQSLDPEIEEVYKKLAFVYIKNNFAPDALIQLEMLAKKYSQKGKLEDELEIRKQMADIDPSHVVYRVKLAEFYSSLGKKKEASDEFRKAAEYLYETGNEEDFIKVAERLLWHEPDDRNTLKNLANAYLNKNNPQKILKRLLSVYKKDPNDIENLHLLARVFLNLNKQEKALQVYEAIIQVLKEQHKESEQHLIYKRILEIDPQNNNALIALGKKSPPNSKEEEIEEIEEIEELEIEEIEEIEELEIEELEEIEEEAVEVVETTLTSSDKDYIKDAETFYNFGLIDKALDSLDKVNNKNHINYLDLEKQIYIKLGNKQKLKNIYHKMAEYHSKYSSADELNSLLKEAQVFDSNMDWLASYSISEPITQTIDMDDALDMLDELSASDGETEQLELEDLMKDMISEAVHSEEKLNDELIQKEKEFIIDEKEIEDLNVDVSDMLKSLKGLTGEYDVSVTQNSSDFSEEEMEDSEVIDENDVISNKNELDVLAEASQAFVRLDEMSNNIKMDELIDVQIDNQNNDKENKDNIIEIDFGEKSNDEFDLMDEFPSESLNIINNDYSEETSDIDTNNNIQSQFSQPSMRDISKLAEFSSLASNELNFNNLTPPTGGNTWEFAEIKEQTSEKEIIDENVNLDELNESLEEIDFFIDQGLEDDAKIVLLDLKNKFLNVKEFQERVQKYNNIAKDKIILEENKKSDTEQSISISDEEASVSNNENLSIDSFNIDNDEKKPIFSESEQVVEEDLDLDFSEEEVTAIGEEILSYNNENISSNTESTPFPEVKFQFEKPVEEDAKTHLDLGMAYKEMGILSQAIEEFKQASKYPDAEVQSKIMIAKCHEEQKHYTSAANTYKSLLHLPSLTKDEELNIYFELGKVYEITKDTSEALYYYKKVFRHEPSYRGVGDIIKQIENDLSNQK